MFQLYMLRLSKRKGLLSVILTLPIIVSFLYIKTYTPSYSDELAVMLSTMVGILVSMLLVITRIFNSDKKHMTTQRILLSTNSKLSMYSQTIAVYLFIAIVQMVVIVLIANLLLPADISLSMLQAYLLLIAYSLLVITATGIGFLILYSGDTSNGVRNAIFQGGFVLTLLAGLFYQQQSIPSVILDYVVEVIPTFWLSEVIAIVLEDLEGQLSRLAIYMTALAGTAAIVVFLLSRTKTRKM